MIANACQRLVAMHADGPLTGLQLLLLLHCTWCSGVVRTTLRPALGQTAWPRAAVSLPYLPRQQSWALLRCCGAQVPD